MTVTLSQFIHHHRQEFAKYGFIACPLEEHELEALYLLGAETDAVYGVGCDVNAGLSFDIACEINL